MNNIVSKGVRGGISEADVQEPPVYNTKTEWADWGERDQNL